MNKLTSEEKSMIEKALDLYRLEGESFLKGHLTEETVRRMSRQVRDLQLKVWKL